jgi:GNAT superfamily N-acetyltransferase
MVAPRDEEAAMDTTAQIVRPLTADDVPRASAALARAFHDDPVGAWMFPAERRRTAALERFFSLHIREMVLPGGACITAADGAGAALWKPPGTWKTPPLLIVRLLPALTRIFGRRLPLLLRGLSEIEKAHPREPHFYLPIVGVAPEHQNRGLGSALMAPVLQRCDRDGLGAYLEATAEANLRLYERHGFQVTHELHISGGLTLWSMWRAAR